MNNLIQLVIGILLGIIGQTLTFFQLQASTRWDWFKNNYPLMVLMGIPISIIFIHSVKNLVAAFDGQLWPSRLIGFSIGAVVFTILSSILFNEPLSLKTVICLLLALAILLIQLFVK
jgi:hypothetical protein